MERAGKVRRRQSCSVAVDYRLKKKSLKYLNIESLRVGKVHHSLSTLPNDVKAVKKSNTKIRLLTSTYILQENRVRFNQYSVYETCTLCLTNAESRQHFLVECSRLEKIRHQFRSQISQKLLQNNSDTCVQSYISNNERLTHLLLDSTVYGANGSLVLIEETIYRLEKTFKKMVLCST